MRSAGWWFCAGLCLAIPGCDDNTPLCVPNTTVACFCYTGDPGQRVCNDEGLKYSRCACLSTVTADANPDADAGADAAATPQAADEPSALASPAR